MRSPEAYARLQSLYRPVLTSEEIASSWGTSSSATNHLLRGLEADGLVRRLRRGVWGVPREWGAPIDPLDALLVLTRPYPSYGSLWTALATHGVIEQVPRLFYAVSLERAHRITTSIGEFQISAIHPDLFGGMTGASGSRAGMATPEKALFDTVYVYTVHQLTHISLPEVTLTEDFDAQIVWGWVSRIASARLRTIVTGRLKQILASAQLWDGS